MQGYVSISIEEWAEIQERLALLDALEAAGVDNWHGFEHAQDLLEEHQNEQDN